MESDSDDLRSSGRLSHNVAEDMPQYVNHLFNGSLRFVQLEFPCVFPRGTAPNYLEALVLRVMHTKYGQNRLSNFRGDIENVKC